MNVLTIGLRSSLTEIFNKLIIEPYTNILHIYENDKALHLIKNTQYIWDWIIIQGHDNPEHWNSIICAVNAKADNTPITVLSSHIDGTKLQTPVCSMHSNKINNQMVISRCAMQNLLQEDLTHELYDESLDSISPIIFEYHAPCR